MFPQKLIVSAKVKEAFTTLYNSMDDPFKNECNLSGFDGWCYTHKAWCEDPLETYGVTNVDLKTLEEISKFYDAQLPPEKQHEWGPWHYMTELDVVRRSCVRKGCLGELRITGQVLASLNHNQTQHAIDLLGHMWENLTPHTVEVPVPIDQAKKLEGLIHQIFPGTVEIPSTVVTQPPEFTEETYERIIEWLNTPYQSFKGNLPEFWELRIVTNYSMPAGKELAEGDLVDSGPHMNSYYTTIVRRAPVVLQDDRYFMEVAIRHDTGEPVATCNHQGSFQQYMAEIEGEPF